MTAIADPENTEPPKASKKPLLIGVLLALLGAGGSFYIVSSGIYPPSAPAEEKQVADDHGDKDHAVPDFEFVALDPLIVSLPRGGNATHLRFAAQLDVDPQYAAEVTALKPRIVDILNNYLRAVDVDEFDDPNVLIRMRAQMLRRVQIVTGEGRVRDLLIMEFVLN